MTVAVASRASVLAAFAVTLFAGPAAAGGCLTVACYQRVATPPVYDTVSEQVMVSPGGRFWQQSYDAHGRLVGCWITTPPRFAVRTRRVLVRPAEVIPETLPPVYANFQHRVLVQPPGSAWVPAGPVRVGTVSIPDALGITGASSADIGVALGFSTGSIYDGYAY